MRIRNPQDIDQLQTRIQEELGIDIQKYRNDEAVQDFFDLLVFPKYVLKWLIRPLGIAIVVFLIGFFVFDINGFENVIYGIFGSTLFLVGGVLAGVIYVLWKMQKDIRGIIDYVLDVMKRVVDDVHSGTSKLKLGNRKDILALLFNGVMYCVAIPTVSEGIKARIPLMGGFMGMIARKILSAAARVVKVDDEEIESQEEEEASESRILGIYKSGIDRMSNGVESSVGVGFKVVRLPFLILFVFISFFLMLLLWMVG